MTGTNSTENTVEEKLSPELLGLFDELLSKVELDTDVLDRHMDAEEAKSSFRDQIVQGPLTYLWIEAKVLVQADEEQLTTLHEKKMLLAPGGADAMLFDPYEIISTRNKVLANINAALSYAISDRTGEIRTFFFEEADEATWNENL